GGGEELGGGGGAVRGAAFSFSIGGGAGNFRSSPPEERAGDVSSALGGGACDFACSFCVSFCTGFILWMRSDKSRRLNGRTLVKSLAKLARLRKSSARQVSITGEAPW